MKYGPLYQVNIFHRYYRTETHLNPSQFQPRAMVISPTRPLSAGHQTSIENVRDAHAEHLNCRRGNVNSYLTALTKDKALGRLVTYDTDIIFYDECHKSGLPDLMAILAVMYSRASNAAGAAGAAIFKEHAPIAVLPGAPDQIKHINYPYGQGDPEQAAGSGDANARASR